MTTADAAIEPDPTAVRKAADAEYFRRVLLRLVEVSADMVEMEHDQARAQAAYTAETGAAVWPAPDRTVAIDRMARCIRRTISLARRLDEPEAAPGEARDERRADARPRDARADARAAEERRVGEGEALRERSEAPEPDEADDPRPAGEIIADLCRSVGLAVPPGVFACDCRASEDFSTLWTDAEPDACDAAATGHTTDEWPGLVGNGASVLLSEGRFRGK